MLHADLQVKRETDAVEADLAVRTTARRVAQRDLTSGANANRCIAGQTVRTRAVRLTEATVSSAAASESLTLPVVRIAGRTTRTNRGILRAIAPGLVGLTLSGRLVAGIIGPADRRVIRAIWCITAEAVEAGLTAGAIGVSDTLDTAIRDAIRGVVPAVLLRRLRGAARLTLRHALAVAIAALVAGTHRVVGTLYAGAEVVIEDLAAGARARVGAAGRASIIEFALAGRGVACLVGRAAPRRAVVHAGCSFAVLALSARGITSGARVVFALTRIGVAGLVGTATAGRAIVRTIDARIAGITILALGAIHRVVALTRLAAIGIEVTELTLGAVSTVGAVISATGVVDTLTGEVAHFTLVAVVVVVAAFTAASLVDADAFVADELAVTLVIEATLAARAGSLIRTVRRGADLVGRLAEIARRLHTGSCV